MKQRLFELIEILGLTAGDFAKEIDIVPATLTHIKNERSKPTLEHVEKIKKRFPEVNTDWLIFGQTPMFLSSANSQEVDLFSAIETTYNKSGSYRENPMLEPKQSVSAVTPPSESLPDASPLPEIQTQSPQPSLSEMPVAPVSSPVEVKQREAARVIIFYSDNTFEELKDK
jgi:DNA-binding XRE family transcriptional regulator